MAVVAAAFACGGGLALSSSGLIACLDEVYNRQKQKQAKKKKKKKKKKKMEENSPAWIRMVKSPPYKASPRYKYHECVVCVCVKTVFQLFEEKLRFLIALRSIRVKWLQCQTDIHAR